MLKFADGHFSGVVDLVYGVLAAPSTHRKANEVGVIVNTHANEVVVADDSVSVNGEGRYLIAAMAELPDRAF